MGKLSGIEQAEDNLRVQELKIVLRGIEDDVKNILHKVKSMEYLIRKLYHEGEEVDNNGL